MTRDRRIYLRRHCKITVLLKSNGTEEVITDGIKNISEGGIFVNTHNPLPVGSMLHLEFSMPDMNTVTKCKGSVVWGYYPDPLKDGMDLPGMGIEMMGLSPMDVGMISSFVSS